MVGDGVDPGTGFDPVAFLERGVRTASHEDVTEMRGLLVGVLDRHGHEPRVDDAGNVLASRGAGRPHLVLNTHVDTVPPHVPHERDGDVVRGRGACDAKGPLAALLAAFLAVDPEEGRVTLAVTPDEETASTGADALAHGPDPLAADGYVVGEPTGLDVCTAAKGRFEGTIRLTGRNAHAADPGSGHNAVRAAADALVALDGYDERADVPSEDPALGAATLTATTIEGGTAANQVPANCRIGFDRRSVPPETAAGFRAGLEAHLRERVPEAVGVEVALTERETPFLEAFRTPTDDPLVETLRDVSGGEVRPFGAATEASYFAADAPTVVFGPGVLADEEGPVAHADREYVRIGEVRAAADAVESTLRARLG